MSFNNSNQRSLSNDEYLNVSTLAGDVVDVYSTSTSTMNVKLYQTVTYPRTTTFTTSATLTTDQLLPGTVLIGTISTGADTTLTLPSASSMITAVETFLGRPWGVYEEYPLWLSCTNSTGATRSVIVQTSSDATFLLRKVSIASTTMNILSTITASQTWWSRLIIMRTSSTQLLCYTLATAN